MVGASGNTFYQGIGERFLIKAVTICDAIHARSVWGLCHICSLLLSYFCISRFRVRFLRCGSFLPGRSLLQIWGLRSCFCMLRLLRISCNVRLYWCCFRGSIGWICYICYIGLLRMRWCRGIRLLCVSIQHQYNTYKYEQQKQNMNQWQKRMFLVHDMPPVSVV